MFELTVIRKTKTNKKANKRNRNKNKIIFKFDDQGFYEIHVDIVDLIKSVFGTLT